MKTSLERKNEIDKIKMYLLINGINLSNLDLEPLINCMNEFVKNGNDNSIEILPFGYRDKIKLHRPEFKMKQNYLKIYQYIAL